MAPVPDPDEAEIYDLDAMLAIQDETKPRTIPIKVGGKVIKFPSARDWPLAANDELARNNLIGALQVMGVEDKDVEHLSTLQSKHLAGVLAHLQQTSGVEPEDFLVSAKPSATRPRRRR
jgi:hypothetical protein